MLELSRGGEAALAVDSFATSGSVRISVLGAREDGSVGWKGFVFVDPGELEAVAEALSDLVDERRRAS